MTSPLVLASAPHDANVTSTGKVMRMVIYTLIPAFFAHIFFFGCGIIINLILTLTTALISESIILKLRNHSVNRIWRDSSAALTAMILALTLPPLLPWYLTIIGTLFAIVIVKHIFGGLGHNIFNPAMGGFVFLLVSTPLPMTEYVNAVPNNYLNLTPVRSAAIIFNINKEQNLFDAHNSAYKYIISQKNSDKVLGNFDSITGATFLVDAKHEQPTNNVYSFTQAHMSDFSNYNFLAKFTIALLFAMGGLIIVSLRIADFRISLSFFLTVIILSAICYKINPNVYLPTFYHLVFGATIFGGFFILTDPVTAVPKPRGALIFGGIAGVIFIVIRNFGGYPDAIAFSVLLTNACAPLISILTRRREFGSNSQPGDLYER